MRSKTTKPKVLVLYNEPVLPADHPDTDSEREILESVDAICTCLAAGDFRIARLGVSTDPQVLLNGLRKYRPDVVFNLFEGISDHGDTEAYVAGVLQWLGVPFTGCPFQSLCLARNKPLTKRLLLGDGLPTPEFFVVNELPVPEIPLDWPMIVKPGEEDASVGLDQGSVVTDREQLIERVTWMLETYGPPVLIEEYIAGREFNVSLIEDPELRTLPISEITFAQAEPNYWPIVTYDAKWRPDSRDFVATPPRFPTDLSPRLAERLAALAQRAYRLMECRDYARVDFRVRHPSRPYILEVNPNPDISPGAGLARALSAAGSSLTQFTIDLVARALARGAQPAVHSANSKIQRIPQFIDQSA
jgi:D-alanine-D-alanine ligase